MIESPDAPPPPLRTGRLWLRKPSPSSDRAAHRAIFAHPLVVSHRPDPTPLDATASDAKLARDIAHWRMHGFGRWAMECSHSAQIVGFGGVTCAEGEQAAAGVLNLSYHLNPEYWGHGYATELASAAIRFAFDELGAVRVIGLARAWNEGSVRVLGRVGMMFVEEIELGGRPSLLYAIAGPGGRNRADIPRT